MALVPFELSTQFTTQGLNPGRGRSGNGSLGAQHGTPTQKTLHLATHSNRIWIISNHEVQLLSLKAAEKKLNHVY